MLGAGPAKYIILGYDNSDDSLRCPVTQQSSARSHHRDGGTRVQFELTDLLRCLDERADLRRRVVGRHVLGLPRLRILISAIVQSSQRIGVKSERTRGDDAGQLRGSAFGYTDGS